MILYAELQTYQSFSPFSMMDSAGWKQENLRLSKTVIQLYYEDDFHHQDQYEMLILGAIASPPKSNPKDERSQLK